MSKQNKNLIALAVLVIATLVSWRVNRIPAAAPAAEKQQAAKTGLQETPLQMRFKRVHIEMDALYHYRSKPIAFVADPSPFRLPAGMDTSSDLPPKVTGDQTDKAIVPILPAADAVLESGDGLLAHAISLMHIGGVVTFNDAYQVAIDGKLHKVGDAFTVKVQTRLVLILVKALSDNSVTLALGDPEAGTASARVKLK